MSSLTLRIDVSWNGDATEKEVIDYIEYQIGYNCSLSQNNPFIDEDCDAEITIDSVDKY